MIAIAEHDNTYDVTINGVVWSNHATLDEALTEKSSLRRMFRSGRL